MKRWLCYTIRKEDGFKQLSVITEDLQDIYDFITKITTIDSDAFEFEINPPPIAFMAKNPTSNFLHLFTKSISS